MEKNYINMKVASKWSFYFDNLNILPSGWGSKNKPFILEDFNSITLLNNNNNIT